MKTVDNVVFHKNGDVATIGHLLDEMVKGKTVRFKKQEYKFCNVDGTIKFCVFEAKEPPIRYFSPITMSAFLDLFIGADVEII